MQKFMLYTPYTHAPIAIVTGPQLLKVLRYSKTFVYFRLIND